MQRCSRQPPCSSSEAVLEVTPQDEISFSLTWAPKPAIAVSFKEFKFSTAAAFTNSRFGDLRIADDPTDMRLLV
ncbi:hypothetical protein DV515_00005867 [Chloebia gouldiae]|uniref:Uncharacterized protein n=1 Tax=Chloebia gouldiae TaxID=44316 RepID=A0A3L8SMC6_CHLGU|nr:hypothetical protein DV515_00005867 [Chloebia gouldiae]